MIADLGLEKGLEKGPRSGLERDPDAGLGGRVPTRAEGPARLIPIGGGKGGVGKTFLVANLATVLARLGRRVIAVDADLEGPNLHTCLGVRRPRASLAEFAARREEDLQKLLVPTSVPDLQLIAGTESHLAIPQPSHARRVQLIRGLRALPADYVLIDLAAGTHAAVMDYFLVSEEGIVVVAPQPTSVENAYAFLRAAFYRRLRLALLSHDVRQMVGIAMDQRNERGIRTPHELLREVQELDPVEGRRFVETMRAFRPRLVVNEARTTDDIRLGFSMRSVCRKYFGFECEYLGYVNHDPAALDSVRLRRPLVESHPRADAAVYFTRIARKLLSLAPPAREAAGA